MLLTDAEIETCLKHIKRYRAIPGQERDGEAKLIERLATDLKEARRLLSLLAQKEQT